MSTHLSDPAIAAILGYLRDEIGFASFARDLSAHIDQLAAENARPREALENIRSRSSIDLAMQPDPFALTAELCNIHQIADAALAHADRGCIRQADG